jgi:hypothetical protein
MQYNTETGFSGASVDVQAASTIGSLLVGVNGIVSVEAPCEIGPVTNLGSITFTGGADGSTVESINAGPTAFSPGVVDVEAGAGIEILASSDYVGAMNVVGEDAAVLFDDSQKIAALGITDGGFAQMLPRGEGTPTSGGVSRILRVKSLDMISSSVISGVLDLTDNDLLVDYAAGPSPLGTASAGVYDGYTGLVQSGMNAGAWDGAGINTSAYDDRDAMTGLGIVDASDVLDFGAGTTATYRGETVDNTTIIVKYTYLGDANLDGQITGDDYSGIDLSILIPGAFGYFNGDFNYDGLVTGDDDSTIDFNILTQDIVL